MSNNYKKQFHINETVSEVLCKQTFLFSPTRGRRKQKKRADIWTRKNQSRVLATHAYFYEENKELLWTDYN